MGAAGDRGILGCSGDRTWGLPSFHRFALEQHLCSPLLPEVGPSGVSRFDERDLLCASPALSLFFSVDGAVDVVEAFVVHQAGTVILGGEVLDCVAFVLECSAVDAVRHADVESAGVAG